jgi:hypothetical protein
MVTLFERHGKVRGYKVSASRGRGGVLRIHIARRRPSRAAGPRAPGLRAPIPVIEATPEEAASWHAMAEEDRWPKANPCHSNPPCPHCGKSKYFCECPSGKKKLTGNPPRWARDKDIWYRAVDKVKPHWDSYDEPYAVVTTVYQRMGGRTR